MLSDRAVGTKEQSKDLPTVTLNEDTGEPTITIPESLDEPTDIQSETLIQGDGPQVKEGSYILVNYKAVHWDDGSIFFNSWPPDTAPFSTQIGTGQVIPAWDQALLDQTVGSQVLIVAPPAFGYPERGHPRLRRRHPRRVDAGVLMGVALRVIPCLDVDAGRVVKGVNFANLRDAGDPVELAARYGAEGADEVTFLDVSASASGRETMVDVVRRTAEQVFVPLTVGGGVRTTDDVDALLRAGADKVGVNTAAIARPELIAEIAQRFGNQVLVLSVDARRCGEGVYTPSGYEVTTHGGRRGTGIDAIEWARRGEELGAGEILLNSMDADGTTGGFDVTMIKEVRDVVKVPLIASGGAGSVRGLCCRRTSGRRRRARRERVSLWHAHDRRGEGRTCARPGSTSDDAPRTDCRGLQARRHIHAQVRAGAQARPAHRALAFCAPPSRRRPCSRCSPCYSARCSARSPTTWSSLASMGTPLAASGANTRKIPRRRSCSRARRSLRIGIANAILVYLRRSFQGNAVAGVGARHRRVVADALASLPLGWHRANPPGRMLSAMSSDSETATGPLHPFAFAAGSLVMMVAATLGDLPHGSVARAHGRHRDPRDSAHQRGLRARDHASMGPRPVVALRGLRHRSRELRRRHRRQGAWRRTARDATDLPSRRGDCATRTPTWARRRPGSSRSWTSWCRSDPWR